MEALASFSPATQHLTSEWLGGRVYAINIEFYAYLETRLEYYIEAYICIGVGMNLEVGVLYL